MTVLIRFLGLAWITVGLWQLGANLIESWAAFDPSHLRLFFLGQLLRPALALALGLLLIGGSRPLSHLLR
jgi:hypothetical protein